MIRDTNVRKKSGQQKPHLSDASEQSRTLHAELAADIKRAKEAAARCDASAKNSEHDIVKLSEIVFKLVARSEVDRHAKTQLEKIYRDNGIRITKATPNAATPVLKLVAPNLKRDTTLRMSKILQYAQHEGIASDNLSRFIADKGGIVKCAIACRKAQEPLQRQKQARKHDAKVQELEKEGKPLGSFKWDRELQEGFWRCLLRREGDRLVVLSLDKEENINKYTPLMTLESFDEPDFD